ncbi:bifunctional DNA-formamidopyrimidine glycosylase/DNA-(apurinic or apyrimidinic site) lyase [Tepidamorphus sp. 3E244]|uniref:bifunctional DNA-formamidopyrimidine glycosylase/DNA-(apurinic or apyrimidinic site) lyase n=1 Tax=Tepidamorphus sp. 3E244 TaxID=3385498 RepID=UPI0038FC61E5
MPELPEVETVRRGLEPVMAGAKVRSVTLNRADLRFPFPPRFAERIAGQTVVSLGRRAKYLLAELSGGETLLMHLGMSGSFRVAGEVTGEDAFHHARSKLPAHDHVIFDLATSAGPGAQVIYNDPRRFGYMDLITTPEMAAHPLIRDLGLEPTGNRLDGAWLSEALVGKAAPLKAALLDQRIIAGLGNIYVCEALFRSGLSPRRKAGTIARRGGNATDRSTRLAEAVREVIAEAIEAGGSTLRDHMRTDGSLGYFQHRFSVYDREGAPCPKPGCGGTVQRIVQSGRSTFFCPACQR